MDKENYTSFFLRLFSSFFSFFCCCLFSLFPLFLMLSGGDVRPLALVVIGRGQITTPYILVIPSEGDYCFIGRIFSSLCYIFSSQYNHKHNTNPVSLRLSPAPPPPFVSWLFSVFYSLFFVFPFHRHLTAFVCMSAPLRVSLAVFVLPLSLSCIHTHIH